MAEDRDRIVADRIEKLQALRGRGVEGYAYEFQPTHSAAAAQALFDQWESDPRAADADGPVEIVRLAGRVVGKRVMGKSTFIHAYLLQAGGEHH